MIKKNEYPSEDQLNKKCFFSEGNLAVSAFPFKKKVRENRYQVASSQRLSAGKALAS